MNNLDSSIDYALKYNKLYFFIFISLVYLLVIFLYKKFILTDSFYTDLLSEQMSYDRIKIMLENKKYAEWIEMGLTPLFLAIRFFLTTICIVTGLYLLDIKFEFSKIYGIVILSEIIYLIPLLVKFYWINSSLSTDTAYDFEYFSFGSILSLFDPKNLNKLFIYPLQVISIFEIGYWMSLSYCLSLIINKNFNDSFKIILSTYGVGLFFGLIFMTFLKLNIL